MTLLDDTRLWSLMSDAAVELVREEFTWDRVAERCLDAYAGVRRRSRRTTLRNLPLSEPRALSGSAAEGIRRTW